MWVGSGGAVTAFDAGDGSVRARRGATQARGLTVTPSGTWWLDGPSLQRAVGDEVSSLPLQPPFVSALVVPPGRDEPLIVRGAGRLETLAGEVWWSTRWVAYDDVVLGDGTVWMVGPQSVVRHPDGREEPVASLGASIFTADEAAGLVVAGMVDGGLAVYRATSPSSLLVHFPAGRDGDNAAFDVVPGKPPMLLRADGERLLRWGLGLEGPSARVDAEVWPSTALSGDGRQRLLCGPDGRYAIESADGVHRGQLEGSGPPTMCGMVDGVPHVAWGKGQALRDGRWVPLESERSIHGVVGHEGRALLSFSGSYRHGGVRLGERFAYADGPSIWFVRSDDGYATTLVHFRWDGSAYQQVEERPLPRETVQVLPDGTLAMAEGADVVLLGPDGGEARLVGHRRRVSRVVVLPDGLLASAGTDGRVMLWRRADQQLLAEVDLRSGRVGELRYHPEGNVLEVAAFDRRVHTLWLDHVLDPAPELAQALRGRDGVEVREARLVLAE